MDSRKDKFVRINYQPELQRTEYQQKSFLHSFVLEIKANKLAIAAVIFLMVIFVAVLLAPLSPYDPDKMDVVHKLQPPGNGHLFGTDNLGRDYFTRALYGGRVSLQVGFFSMLVTIIFGTVWGTISGFAGGDCGCDNDAYCRYYDVNTQFFTVDYIKCIYCPWTIYHGLYYQYLCMDGSGKNCEGGDYVFKGKGFYPGIQMPG